MTKLIASSFVALIISCSVATPISTARAKYHHQHFTRKNAWINKWSSLDQSIYPAVHEAAKTFGVSEPLMRKIVGDEGGNVNPYKLRRSLCYGSQPGWNLAGSSAFGPFQFMLDYRAPCMHSESWGTFGSYDDAAFVAARKLGNPVPHRFKNPASNVGQAITAAYMIANGGLSHWCSSQC